MGNNIHKKRKKSIKLNIQKHSFLIKTFGKTWKEKSLKIEGKNFAVFKVSNLKLRTSFLDSQESQHLFLDVLSKNFWMLF